MRGNCPGCGATIDLAREVGTGEIIPLELHTDTTSDYPRYRVIDHDGGHAFVERVKDDATGQFQPDHRADCPRFDAGR